MSERLICAVDCTPASPGAVRAATEIGSALGLRLTLLHVADGAGEDQRDAASVLDHSLAGLPLPQDAIHRVETGDAAEQIVAAAGEEEAALILMGSRRVPVRAKAVFGSVAARVIEMSSVPVVLVPPAACRDALKRRAPRPREIVVGVEGSRRSQQAVTTAARLAARARARIVLVHVVPLASAAATPPISMGVMVAPSPRTEPGRLFARLLALVPDSVETSCVVRRGLAGEQLEGFASTREADLIVVGSSRPSRFRRLMFGGTARRVVSRARRPVMVVPGGAVSR